MDSNAVVREEAVPVSRIFERAEVQVNEFTKLLVNSLQ
jgi:hypothetical protein